MNDRCFEFLRTEIAAASGERLRQLMAIEGYLRAAKQLRDEFSRQGRSSEYASVPDFVDRFDRDCARVSP